MYTAAASPADAKWWEARLYTIDVATGTAREIHKPELQITLPRWSPDGKRIAFIGGLMSDQGITGGDIYVVARPGRHAPNLTAGTANTPSWAALDRPQSKRLVPVSIRPEPGGRLPR